jgi:peptide/nickel transport system permease protein
VAAVVEPLAERPVATRRRIPLRAVFATTEGKVGAAIVVVFLFLVAFGPLLAPYDPLEVGVGPPDGTPSAAHWLGTDNLGRDVFSRLLCGARSVIVVPLIATALAFAFGGLIGMLSGYVGGRVDAVITRAIDVLLALPPLLMVLVTIAALGTSTPVIAISVGLVYGPRVARVLRGAVQGVATREHVLVASLRGERTISIVVREVLPNIAPTVLVEFAVRLTLVIIFVTTLNFLGLGIQPPSPNWGLMVTEARATILINPAATLGPVIAIGLLCVGVGLLAEAATRSLGRGRESELLR